MLKEAVMFVNKYDKSESQTLEKDWTEKKFVIIKTKIKDTSSAYAGLEILDSDLKIRKWMDENKHYKKIIKNFDHYVLPHSINKALGSTSGLATYSFFAFKLSEKNLVGLDEKIDKTKFPKDNNTELIEGIHKVLKDAMPDLTEQHDNAFGFLDFHVLIHTDEKRFVEWDKIACDFIKERTARGKAALSIIGNCNICNKNGKVSNPSIATNYDEKKIFLRHNTRHSKDGKGIPLRACGDCVQKLNRFEEILKHYKIKIFPLFIDPDELSQEIKLLSSNLEKDENLFDHIFNQLTQDKNIFDFYLVVKTDDYFFFDYISGYKWEIGEFTNYFEETKHKQHIRRPELAQKLARSLTGKPSIKYFDKIKGFDNQQTTLIYSFRQKIFDFVYRNQNVLTTNDLQNIVLFRIENNLKNNSISKETFNLYFNRHLLLHDENPNRCVLDMIPSIREKIISENIAAIEIDNDEVWAYFAGQMAYYLVSLSKTKNKKYSLLEPFTNKPTIKMVQMTIGQLIEQYRHEINLNNKRFRKIATSVLAYESKKSFIELKIPFYVGTFDDNIVYYKKKGEE